ncbi:MAG: hypothetical protein IPF94_18870 [Betaproteobacteria bacterium]|nr:hypothetical protein [Betaproteobacteria bacterium]
MQSHVDRAGLMPALRENFLARRWRGEVALRRLFWFDMLAVGTVINLFTTFAGLIAVASGASVAWAAALHFAPMPYNVFLFAALWRRPGRPWAMALAAAAWLALMTVI